MDREFFIGELKRCLANQLCWGIVAGAGSGSWVSFSFGRKIRRSKPVDNDCLSEDLRIYNGEFKLFVQDADWRVESSTEILATSVSSNEKGGTMLRGLNQLVDAYVREVIVTPPSMDISIKFSNGLKFSLFCLGAGIDVFDNYSFFSPNGVFSVDHRFQLTFEERG